MILIKTFYACKCDRCGVIHDESDIAYWSSEDDAIQNATDSDWHYDSNKGKAYCPDCYEVIDNDEVKILEDYPKHLKTLLGFIERIMCATSKNVFEYESNFNVKFNLYKRDMELFELDYIKSLLGDRFVSFDIDNEPEYSNSKNGIIVFKK